MPAEFKMTICKGCGGAVVKPGNESPLGWYSISVNVPRDMAQPGRLPYKWVGQFCCVACIEEYLDEMQRMQSDNDKLYTADPIMFAADQVPKEDDNASKAG